MQKLIATAVLAATLAPAAASANSCAWDQFWSDRQQACVGLTDYGADTIQDMGQGHWVQPYTDATADYIRADTTPSCDGCVTSR